MSNQMRQEHVFGSLDVDLEHDPSLGQSPDPGGEVEGLGPLYLIAVDMSAVALECEADVLVVRPSRNPIGDDGCAVHLTSRTLADRGEDRSRRGLTA